MLQDVLLPGQTHKNTVNYSVSAFETRWKPSRTTNKVKPKNCQIGCVFVFFEHSRSKKLRKNGVFFDASQAQNHSVYRPAPSKNSGIYAVFSMLQDVLLPGQTHKNTVNYSVSAFETRWKPSRTTNKVKPKNGQIVGVFVSFWTVSEQKTPLKKKNVFFDASQAQNHGSCGVFLLLEPKTTVFTVFYGQQAKTVVFTQFSACCKTYFCQAKRTKTP